ncbi:MAG: DNA-directed RNA polymerase subunit B, partial [Methanomicrobiaceae archaeon]|nr:DNA-directed RNA polymerase subunit B [Methanomicrobiaceae archaeon]
MKKSRVFVNGALIGLVEDPRRIVSEIRAMRRNGEISGEINVSLKEYNGDVVIHTDRGRARRPLIVIEGGRPLVTEEDLVRLESGEIDFADLVGRGCIELIDAEEEEDLFIAIRESDLTPEHTHLE